MGDPRPRADWCERILPSAPYHPQWCGQEGPKHFVEPTSAELTSLFRDAKSLIEKQGNALGESGAAIAYAWNENSEGGWLLPTKGEGDSRTKAVADALFPPLSRPAPTTIRTPNAEVVAIP